MIAGSFYTYLNAQISVPIYPQVLPQRHNGFPAITYIQDDNLEQTLLDGTNSSLLEARFQVDCWANSYNSVHQLAEDVKAALTGYTGPFGDYTADHIRKEREIDLFEQDTGLHRVSMQFFIAYA